MEFYTNRYDIGRLINKCQNMDLIELMEYLRNEIDILSRIKNKSEDMQRYKNFIVELEAVVTGEPRLVSDCNKEYIKAVIQHFVLESKMSQDILEYLE